MQSDPAKELETPRPGLLYRLYQRRLRREIDGSRVPHHIAVIVDGNRRWAKQRLQERAAYGHRAGARKIPEFLSWCEEAGVEVVTLYLLSADNLGARDRQELEDLFGIIAELARELADKPQWRVKHVGACDGLSEELASALAAAEERTAERPGLHINLAVGYGGRSEIAAAVHGIIEEHQEAGGSIDTLADHLTPESIGEHLWTRGQPDPDLVIRTSGEQRLSDFMIWQSAHSEFYFVEALYPDLREVDFLRALRDYSTRQRRLGG
ncbi:isoprenyl transferase [Leucobacter sp. Psy1]|uniref:isoprenyl transferase n=1 Tax=Leucobacter sp. Psy1 TaxID=2875729 RepID=UPI001CD619DF|nr:isoprenyl transferase [Leucobacter sp. Psy1]UBH06700.1 isoprenyl transferase [Leucobacter sp. Psy1]